MAKYGKFTVGDAKKVAEATRRVLSGPRTMLNVPYRPAIRQGGASTVADGFPPGTSGCDCGHCVEGVTMPASSTECCNSHLRWDFVDPVFGGTKSLLWTTGNVWLTDPFTGPDCGGNANEYRWQLTVDIDGETLLELVIETDYGCDIACVQFVTDEWQCQCNNDLERTSKWENVDWRTSYCKVCLKPVVVEGLCDVLDVEDRPFLFTLELTDISGVVGDCDSTVVVVSTLGEAVTCGLCGSSQLRAQCTWFFACTTDESGACIGYWLNYNSYFANRWALILIQCGDTSVHYARWISPAGWMPSDGPVNFAWHSDGVGGTARDDVTVTPSSASDYPTSSGSCAGCTTDTPPADPDPEACCIDSTCYDYISPTDCSTLNGVTHADLATCEANCEENGQCCVWGSVDTHECYNVSSAICFEFGLAAVRSIWTVNDDCETACPPIGACCDEGTGDCTEFQTEAECNGVDDVWYEGQLCSEITCTAVVGCCTDPGAIDPCENLTEAACNSDHPGWDWTGPPAVCCPGLASCDVDGGGDDC